LRNRDAVPSTPHVKLRSILPRRQRRNPRPHAAAAPAIQPLDLVVAPSPFGDGEVLLSAAALEHGDATAPASCIAPVGVRVRAGETEETLDRWRCATWTDGGGIWSGHPPERVEDLTLAELAARVPGAHRHWMARQLDGQLKAIVAFGAGDDGDLPDPEYLRWSHDAAEQLRRELVEAFPGERWHVAQPGTGAAIHDAAPALA
jgi:hypothetical protein